MNTDTLHTPGPWKLDGGNGKKGERYVWSDRAEKGKGYIGTHEICVAVVKPNAKCEGTAAFAEEEIEANARLIATAPELLAACREALSQLGDAQENVINLCGAACEEAQAFEPSTSFGA